MNKTKKKPKAAIVLRKFISYYRPYMAIFVADLICALILAGVDLAFPQLLRVLINDVFLSSSQEIMQILGPVAILIVVLYLLRTASQYYITRWGHIMGSYMETDMRQDLFTQFSRLSFSYYDKNQSGDMASRLLTDLFDISELAHHGPENLLICTLKIVGSFVLLFFISVPLTVIMLAATVVMAVYSAWVNYRRRVVFSRNRQRMGQMNSQITDSLGGIRTVQSFANEKNELDKFERINDKYLDTKKESYKFIANFTSANSLFQGVLYLVTVVGGGFCVAQGSLAPTELAIFALYIGIFIAPIEQLINFAETFQKGYAGFSRFCEIMAEVPEIKNKRGAKNMPYDLNTDIVYRDVYFTYKNDDDKVAAIKNMNLTVESGQTVALVGPSGEGKSTTCSLLPRFYDIDSGSITIGGIDIRDFKLESLRKNIGILQQEVYLFDGTIAENIKYGKEDVPLNDIFIAAKAANIHDYIMTLRDGYNTRVGERGARLSGGQKQRIAIARLFLRDPKIIILDEATSALDNESEAAVQKSLDRLCKGKTTIVIAHRLSTIKAVDKIAVIHDGSVAELGTHDQLMQKDGIYANYYNLQFKK